MRYWLLKSEPDVYSIEDMRRDGRTGWEGIRNYQARNFLREMKKGDRALFYHSNADPPSVVGMVEVVREAYPDPEQFDRNSRYFDPKSPEDAPRWSRVDVTFLKAFPKTLPLNNIRGMGALQEMQLVRQGRLSVQPVGPLEWKAVLKACS